MSKNHTPYTQNPRTKIQEPKSGFIQHHFHRLVEYCKNGAGFTLIELLVVMVIISGLAGLLVANFIGVRQRGRDAQRKSDLSQIQSALELYRSDNGSYPMSLASCGNPFTYNSITYMQKIPCDPREGTSYTFSSTGTTYSIYACLENANDQARDANDGLVGDLCAGSGVVSYTVKNP